MRVVILGAGFAGLEAALTLEPLAAAGEVEVTLIDRASAFQMGFAMQWVLLGRRPPEGGRREYPPGALRHTRFVHEEVRSINIAGRLVETDRGSHPFDRLVLAMGAELAPDSVQGLVEGAFNLFSMDGVLRLKEEIANVREGTVAVVVAAVPFKCPPAPYEYAFILDELLHKTHMRKHCQIVVATPEPQPMPVAGKAVGEAVIQMLGDHGIGFRPGHKLTRVDGANKTAHFEGGATLPYAVLAAVPPHRAPRVVRDAGLADASGFVPVELGSFQTKAEGVFAVGDVASIRLPTGSPHPKAGVFAQAQGAAVGSAIASEIRGKPAAPYAGLGVCFIDVGGGHAAPAEANLLADGGPRFRLEPPSAAGVEGKAAFERERLERWFGRA